MVRFLQAKLPHQGVRDCSVDRLVIKHEHVADLFQLRHAHWLEFKLFFDYDFMGPLRTYKSVRSWGDLVLIKNRHVVIIFLVYIQEMVLILFFFGFGDLVEVRLQFLFYFVPTVEQRSACTQHFFRVCSFLVFCAVGTDLQTKVDCQIIKLTIAGLTWPDSWSGQCAPNENRNVDPCEFLEVKEISPPRQAAIFLLIDRPIP